MCFDHEDDKKSGFRFYRYDTTVSQVNAIDAAQPYRALTIAESIALKDSETVRRAQEILRPAPELDRQLQSRYDEPRYEYRDEERYFMELQRADLYRYGY